MIRHAKGQRAAQNMMAEVDTYKHHSHCSYCAEKHVHDNSVVL